MTSWSCVRQGLHGRLLSIFHGTTACPEIGKTPCFTREIWFILGQDFSTLPEGVSFEDSLRAAVNEDVRNHGTVGGIVKSHFIDSHGKMQPNLGVVQISGHDGDPYRAQHVDCGFSLLQIREILIHR